MKETDKQPDISDGSTITSAEMAARSAAAAANEIVDEFTDDPSSTSMADRLLGWPKNQASKVTR